jgi:hypothetical protein
MKALPSRRPGKRLVKALLCLLAILPASLFANGVVHIPEPGGGFSGNPDEGITFGDTISITPTADASTLSFDLGVSWFRGDVQIGDQGAALYSPYSDTDLYVTPGINTGWLTLRHSLQSFPQMTLGKNNYGEIQFGSGTADIDTTLARSAAGVLQINGQTIVTQNTLANYVTLTGTQTLTNKTIEATQLTGTMPVSVLPEHTTRLGSVIDLNSTETAGTLPVAKGGTGATTLTGILKGNGTNAVTTVTAPAGALVGTTDTQTLSNKTLTGPVQVNGKMVLSGALATGGGTATGENAVGLAGEAIADNSAALTGGRAYGISSTALSGGYAAGDSSTAISGGTSFGITSTAMSGAYSSGDYSTAMGGSDANGEYSTAMSAGTADADYSTAINFGVANYAHSTAIGEGIYTQAEGQVAIGTYNTLQATPTDDLFVVGNGVSDSARSNAFVIKKNGNTSINGNLTVSGAVSFANAPTIGANTVVTQNQLSSYQTTTGSGAGLTSLNASALSSGTVPVGALPSTVTQLGAKVDLDNNDEIQGDLAWGRVSGKPTTVSGYGITDSIAVTRNTSGRITSAIHIEPQGDISMGQFD